MQKILKESLALEAGYNPQVAWLDPVQGNFDPIEQITLKDDGSLTKLVATAFQGTDTRPGNRNPEEETSVDNGEAQVEKRNRKAVAADVRAAADARGSIPRAKVQAAPKKASFFERVFGPRRPPAPQPGPRR